MEKKIDIKITSEPYVEPTTLPCYAVITEECTNRVFWHGGPYQDKGSADRAAGRQLRRMQKEPGRGLFTNGDQ
jgi:hypothetical protein